MSIYNASKFYTHTALFLYFLPFIVREDIEVLRAYNWVHFARRP